MKRIVLAATAITGLITASPALAWQSHSPNYCGGTSTSSGGTAKGSTSSGGLTSTGGTDVPEPGMLGMMGLGFIGMAAARRRR